MVVGQPVRAEGESPGEGAQGRTHGGGVVDAQAQIEELHVAEAEAGGIVLVAHQVALVDGRRVIAPQ